MENASKALLIAGAILICILIIGVGMMVFQSIQGTLDEGIQQMSSQEKQMFNSQFTQSSGNRVNGSTVKSLLNTVNSNNTTNKEIAGKVVKVTGVVSTDSNNQISSTSINNLNTARNYKVLCTDTDNDGLIDNIAITMVTN